MELQEGSKRVLELLVAYDGDEGDLARDEELNGALDPFRGIGPFSVHCGRVGCNRVISWWALPVRGQPPFARAMRRSQEARGIAPSMQAGFVWGSGLRPIAGGVIVHSSWGPRRAEVRGDAGKSVSSWHPDPFRDWSVGVVDHEHDAVALDAAHSVFLFTCPRKACSAQYRLSNKEMLALFVAAVGAGANEIRLPPPPV